VCLNDYRFALGFHSRARRRASPIWPGVILLARRHRGSKFRPVPLPALQAAKVDLYTAFLVSGLKKVELARRIGIPKTHIERLFSLRHHSRLNQIEAAFAALGKRLHVEARDAA
jgi:hypothetical protein